MAPMAPMVPTLIALLCFELCVGQRIRTQAGTLFRPTLKADSGPLIPRGTAVTLRCKGHPGATWYGLKKGESQSQNMTRVGMEAQFNISSMTKDTAGSYCCLYKSQSGLSEPSEPLELVMTGFYDKPTLAVISTQEEAEGHSVTLLCHSEQQFDRFTLYKGIEANTSRLQKVWFWTQVSSASLATVQEGIYRCYSFHSQYPYLWSAPSDSLEVRITGSPCPLSMTVSFSPDATPQDYTACNLIRLSLAGLVLIILGGLLVDTWYNLRELQRTALA
ncbi:leukocyte immunoglobulin-like receptor subfamily A member 5 [Dromiciops gliroides]|uniref:leukocyte immunoglobulin-like receptor subfamily A member 5 n=1 Tax=Dromiciops gliroides TaxID=33562 RepID=UPI001CC33D5C|nr:leukocyte immunoglobulin-like receptor subfamily A member 5 [Dromiciops gliroides]